MENYLSWNIFARNLIAALICAVLSALTLSGAQATEQVVQQQLDRRTSVVAFSVASQLLNFSGRFTNYSGEISLNTADPTRSIVRLSLNPSQLTFDNGVEPFPGFGDLLKQLPDKTVYFESTKIQRLDKDRYRVHGLARFGKKSSTTVLPVTAELITAAHSRFKIAAQGSAADALSTLPLPPMFADSQGTMKAVLEFVK
jgi:polyisoprenoid-binding protein YceI